MLLPNVYSLGYNAGQKISSLVLNQTLPEIPSFLEVYGFVTSLPSLYKDWWLNLVSNDPVHVFVETTLLLSVVYMIVSKNKDWREDNKERLTEAEKDELLTEWRERGRASLVPHDECLNGAKDVVVHGVHGRTMDIQQGSTKRTVLNFATHDFLGMASSSLVDDSDGPGVLLKDASRKALTQYGCGSCGPRGFYGTIDVHLDLEDAISKFTGTEGAIMYSDGASTVSSTIAAFAKRGDLLVVDDGVYEPLVTGVRLSRANVKWFRHNDMDDLRRVLKEVETVDKRLRRKANDQRRFIVVEGLYKNSGTIVPFDELVALKQQFNYRLILDESFSFGTLGATGKGVIEANEKKHMYDAEIVCISLENSLGSIGGVTVGNEEVVDHQRLSGAGYCFSASCPPFTASAAINALEQLKNRPELLARLNENKKYLHEQLVSSMKEIIPDRLIRTSDERSPIVFLELADTAETFMENSSFHDDVGLLDAIVEECLQNGAAMVSTGRQEQGNVHTVPPPAIRLTVSATHTKVDIDRLLNILKEAVLHVMTK